MPKIFNSTLDETAGYIFSKEGDIAVVNKATGECMQINFGPQEILEDASKAYIKNDIYMPEEKVKTAKEECAFKTVPDYDCDLNESGPIEVADDIKHHLEAKDFGEYLIVIGDYSEKDFDVFVGTKAELNEHIAKLHLVVTPKVYMLKQLQVKTKYEVL